MNSSTFPNGSPLRRGDPFVLGPYGAFGVVLAPPRPDGRVLVLMQNGLCADALTADVERGREILAPLEITAEAA